MCIGCKRCWNLFDWKIEKNPQKNEGALVRIDVRNALTFTTCFIEKQANYQWDKPRNSVRVSEGDRSVFHLRRWSVPPVSSLNQILNVHRARSLQSPASHENAERSLERTSSLTRFRTRRKRQEFSDEANLSPSKGLVKTTNFCIGKRIATSSKS